MEQLIEFAGNHWMLVAAFVVLSAMLIQNVVAGESGGLDPKGATELINRENALVLDVRPMNDFSQGHIINAKNMPLGSLQNQLKQIEKYKNKPIVVVCRSGAQSATACRQLKKAGFEKAMNLKGGILAWQSDNLPVSRK